MLLTPKSWVKPAGLSSPGCFGSGCLGCGCSLTSTCFSSAAILKNRWGKIKIQDFFECFSPYSISSLAKSSGSGMLRPFSTVERIVFVIEETDDISDFGGANQPHPPSSL
jgi:hypothetical protein